jgi:hypothetical protein
VFIEHDVVRDVDSVCGHVRALVSFVHWVVAKEHTLHKTIGKFCGSIGSEVRPVGTPECLKLIVVGFVL